MDLNRKVRVFDMGRFRNEDGPGIRTIIFFKGCSLFCRWCSNPFGLSEKPQVIFNRELCMGCGACIDACPNHALSRAEDGKITMDFTKCCSCGSCTKVCRREARRLFGKEYTVGELLDEAMKDADFYRRDNGGVTLSGGEILMQHEAAADLLEACYRRLLHTCIETSAYAPWEHLEKVLKYTSMAFIDLKHIDSKKHESLTGVPNELILQNIQRASEYMHKRGRKIVIRRVIVPGLTDDDANTIETAKFVSGLSGHPEINLLPYHNLGEAKYEMAGMHYDVQLSGKPMMQNRDELLRHIKELTEQYAPENRCSIGGQGIDL